MEEEAEKLKQLQSEVDKQMNMGSPPGISKFTNVIFCMKHIRIKIYILILNKIIFMYFILASPLNMSLEDKMEVDNRSIYVGNVSII